MSDDSIARAVEILRDYVNFRGGNAEHRPQQEHMVSLVEGAIVNRRNLICQAGTGTGKSLGYLVGLYAAGGRAVVSTATKALGEQLAEVDMPSLNSYLESTGSVPMTYTLLKGRGNYLCKLKLDQISKLGEQAGEIPSEDDVFGGAHEQESLDLGIDLTATVKPAGKGKEVKIAELNMPEGGLRDEIEEYKSLIEWSKTTVTGDRSDGPATGDWAWDQVSISSAACLGASNCPFASECFSEKAREAARMSDVTITNHALLATDLERGSGLFGGVDAVIVDEVHEFEKALSSAWGSSFAPVTAHKAIRSAVKQSGKEEKIKKLSETALSAVESIELTLMSCDPGLMKVIPPDAKGLLSDLTVVLSALAADMSSSADKMDGGKAGRARAAAQTMEDIKENIEQLLIDSDQNVRWLEIPAKGGPVLKCSPLDVGSKLQQELGGRVLIGTSATCAVGGSFDSLVNTLKFNASYDEENDSLRPYDAVDVGTPYDWESSVMLYIPEEGFPEPVGKERAEHTEAVLETVLDLVRSSGGRTLFLSTTTSGARNVGEFLRGKLPVNVYVHGDGTAGQLADWFIRDETSVLCATMGMWAGISPVGATCSLVIIDKIPFPPMDDPLVNARSTAADERGGNGFMEISVAHAGLMLAQGAGRLIRSSEDKGVVAILDRRLLTKRYGRALISSLPKVRVFSDRNVVMAALTRLTGGVDPEKHVESLNNASMENKELTRAREKKNHKYRGSADYTVKKYGKSSWGRGAKAPITSSRRKKINNVDEEDGL